MKLHHRVLLGISLAAAGLLLWAAGRPARPAEETRTAAVTRGPLQVWSVYDGKLESRNIRTLLSRIGGAAALIDLTPEGAKVAKGDVVARFDTSKTERDLVKLEADVTLAASEYESLQNAQIPLKLRELELQLAEAEASLEGEKDYLEDSRSLRKEDLISEQEIRQQEAKVNQAQTKCEHLRMQLDLNQKYLNPLALNAAKARLASAEQALALARQEVEQCVLKAPADGMIVYLPAHIAGEYRTVRVGDSVYKNQPFLAVPDMSNLVIHCYVPESELSRVAAGYLALITPVAFPGLVLTGQVDSVGSMAQTLMDKPTWQKYFHVIITLRNTQEDLRSGMSVIARILSYENADVVLAPRAAIAWEDGRARCRVVRHGRDEERNVVVGHANDTHAEILEGLSPGERVAVE